MSKPRMILVPVDFSEPSEKALVYAIDLAKELGAKVHVVHAFELPIIGFPDGALVTTADMAGRILSAAQGALDDARAKYGNRGVEVSTQLVQADPRDGILGAAKECGADLVVMGTHGRRGLARALMGSVAESVVRTSNVPVLTVRSAA